MQATSLLQMHFARGIETHLFLIRYFYIFYNSFLAVVAHQC